MLTILSQTPSVVNRYVTQLRDVTVQGDSMRFRQNIERIGNCMAYELSKHLAYKETEGRNAFGYGDSRIAYG